jgi:hypothetical protein
MAWEPMHREDAQGVFDAFFEHRDAVTLSFEQHVQLREAFLILMGADRDVIRRALEDEWGVPLE